MWTARPITGKSLPKKHLCLTFDDGPAERQTLEIAEYLAGEGIEAAFFAVGVQAQQFPSVLPEVASLGHAVGNHTMRHRKLNSSLLSDYEAEREIVEASGYLPPVSVGERRFFRPPYGAWNRHLTHVMGQLPGIASSYIGPVGWDAGGQDFRYWRDGLEAEACAEAYLRQIESMRGGGIVLIHDGTADDARVAARNRAFDLVRKLVPVLRKRGFQFVSLASVPSIHEMVTGFTL